MRSTWDIAIATSGTKAVLAMRALALFSNSSSQSSGFFAIAGTIAAVTNNASGVAGVAYGAKVLPSIGHQDAKVATVDLGDEESDEKAQELCSARALRRSRVTRMCSSLAPTRSRIPVSRWAVDLSSDERRSHMLSTTVQPSAVGVTS